MTRFACRRCTATLFPLSVSPYTMIGDVVRSPPRPSRAGFKRLDGFRIQTRIAPGPSLRERVEFRRRAEQLHEELRAAGVPPPEPDYSDWEAVCDQFDRVDHVIDLHGHIIGMCLSPNQRWGTDGDGQVVWFEHGGWGRG